MFSWITECYKDDKEKLYSTYETALFTWALDKKVLRALAMILGLKNEIKVEVGVVKMAYSIIYATFISLELVT